MQHMNVTLFTRSLSTLLLAIFATSAGAQQPGASGNPIVKSELHKLEATVEKIDYNTREVTLRGAEGPVSLVVGPEAKNLEKVRVGDKVIVSYYQGLAAEMSKGGRTVKEPAMSAFGERKEGGKWPGGIVGGSVTTTVTIEDVEPDTHTVAFRRPDGSVHLITVKSPEMQKFVRMLKRGDKVDVTYTESVAIDVEMAQASKK